MGNNNKIYATDSNLLKYVFSVLREDDDFLYVKDISTTSYEIGNHIFKVRKNPLMFVDSDGDRTWDFMFKDKQFFASFNELEVAGKAKEYQRSYDKVRLGNTIKGIAKLRKNIKDAREFFLKEYGPEHLSTLAFNDKLFVLDDDKNLQSALVTAKIEYANGDKSVKIHVPIFHEDFEIFWSRNRFDAHGTIFYIYSDTPSDFFGDGVERSVFMDSSDYERFLSNEELRKMQKNFFSLTCQRDTLFHRLIRRQNSPLNVQILLWSDRKGSFETVGGTTLSTEDDVFDYLLSRRYISKGGEVRPKHKVLVGGKEISSVRPIRYV
ncbi:MAG: hypothetical protein UH850_10545 [Paludibacteraceae bacterium]|nr:hypothetical protein [Paludibacteraceae bacterium]